MERSEEWTRRLPSWRKRDESDTKGTHSMGNGLKMDIYHIVHGRRMARNCLVSYLNYLNLPTSDKMHKATTYRDQRATYEHIKNETQRKKICANI